MSAAGTEREPGFYWVRLKDYGYDPHKGWTPAQYDCSTSWGKCWWVIGCEAHFHEAEFQEIGEKIERG